MTTATKLDPEFKARWIAALRSGEFKQGEGRLCSRGPRPSYCCLGVARKIDGVEGCYQGDWGSEYYPPKKALDKWGLPYSSAAELARMNDGGKSFAEIADYIEQNL